MNGIIKNVLRTPAIKNLLSATTTHRSIRNDLTRTLSHMCCRQSIQSSLVASKFHQHTDTCSCGCRSAHTKASKELVEFLAEEIVAEKKAQKLKTIPSELDGFKVSLDGAEVTLTKTGGNETIKIHFNINHSVDAEAEPDIDPQDDKADIGEMKSKPSFSIDIIRGSQTLGFTCSFNNEPGASGADDSYNDIFGIDEITLYEGQHSDKVYAVAGEIIDGYLYDLLMNYLEEKGVSNELAEKLVDLSTNYEHTAYISLLEGLSKFTSEK